MVYLELNSDPSGSVNLTGCMDGLFYQVPIIWTIILLCKKLLYDRLPFKREEGVLARMEPNSSKCNYAIEVLLVGKGLICVDWWPVTSASGGPRLGRLSTWNLGDRLLELNSGP